jgi:hypothetical protein
MNHRAIDPRHFMTWTAMIVLALTAVATPIGQRIVVSGLVELAEVTERIVRFPCWVLDHSRCFSLDRFDPTCPQCL